jgi:putative membrane protein
MRKLAALVLVPALLASCAPMMTAPNAGTADALFLQSVTGSNLFEIQSSEVALTKATAPAVRAYAQMLIEHHTTAQNEVSALALARGVLLPKALPPELQLKVTALSGLNAAAFDAAFLQEQVLAHQLTLSLIQNERAAGKDAAVVALADRQSPIIQQHLQQAQTLLVPAPAPTVP